LYQISLMLIAVGWTKISDSAKELIKQML